VDEYNGLGIVYAESHQRGSAKEALLKSVYRHLLPWRRMPIGGLPSVVIPGEMGIKERRGASPSI